MSGPQHRFDPAELRIPGEPEPTLAEQADALATARDLEAIAQDAGIRPTAGFEDRVMAAIAAEPAPRLVVTPAGTVRGGLFGAFLLTVRQSWAVATAGGRPMAVRAQALAFVLLVVLAAGALTSVTALTVGALLGPNGSTNVPDRSAIPTAPVETPSVPAPSATPAPTVQPTDTTGPTQTAEPTETAQPTETARPTRTARPTETPGASDDHGGGGGNSGPGGGGGSDDGSGGSSGGGGKGPG